MATQSELVEDLKRVKEGQAKSLQEIEAIQVKSDEQAANILRLEEALANQENVSPELAAAVADVVSGQKALDDEIPDVAPPV